MSPCVASGRYLQALRTRIHRPCWMDLHGARSAMTELWSTEEAAGRVTACSSRVRDQVSRRVLSERALRILRLDFDRVCHVLGAGGLARQIVDFVAWAIIPHL